MDRQEFSAMVKAARERKGLSIYRVSLDSTLTRTQVMRIERAENAYNIQNMLLLLRAMKTTLVLQNPNSLINIVNLHDVVNTIGKMTENISCYAICKKTGISQPMIKYIVEGKTTPSIDTFLKLTNYFGYTLSIVDKEE